jgi:hypothetical protein
MNSNCDKPAFAIAVFAGYILLMSLVHWIEAGL